MLGEGWTRGSLKLAIRVAFTAPKGATAEIQCMWRIPPGTSGKSLVGSIELTFRGKPVSQNFSALITP